MGTLTSTNGVVITTDNVCLLYNQTTGAILHRHRAITLTGGRVPAQDEIEKDALANAAKVGVNTAGLQILHTSGSAMAVPGVYRVDPATRAVTLVRASVTPQQLRAAAQPAATIRPVAKP